MHQGPAAGGQGQGRECSQADRGAAIVAGRGGGTDQGAG